MDKNYQYPVHIFPDITNENKDFPKYTKRDISEDYIAENYTRLGWSVYRPIRDTGLDMVITKINNDNGIKMTRFIQVKTRALKPAKSKSDKKYFLGFTLGPQYFHTDPRMIFVLLNDDPSINGHCNVFTIPMYQFMKFFYDHSSCMINTKNHNTKDNNGHKRKKPGDSYFATPSFRQENNKSNSLMYDPTAKYIWAYDNYDFSQFKDKRGYQLINTIKIENNFSNYVDAITKYKSHLYYLIRKSTVSNELTRTISGLKKIKHPNTKQTNDLTKLISIRKSPGKLSNLTKQLQQEFTSLLGESNQSRVKRFRITQKYFENHVKDDFKRSSNGYMKA